MSESSYRNAISSRRGQVKINLDVMTTTVQMLKANPSLPAIQLRPLLKSALISVTALDSRFLNNFRIKVANFHAKHQNNTVIRDSSLVSYCRICSDWSLLLFY